MVLLCLGLTSVIALETNKKWFIANNRISKSYFIMLYATENLTGSVAIELDDGRADKEKSNVKSFSCMCVNLLVPAVKHLVVRRHDYGQKNLSFT